MDLFNLKAQGTLYINEVSPDGTRTPVLEKDNAVHLGNFSTILAQAALGKSTAFIAYMAFGNAGANIESNGVISYKTPNVSGFNNPSERLYNTVLIRRIRNYASGASDLDVSTSSFNTNYEDIIVQVILDEIDGEPDLDSTEDLNDFVFNEIALYAGDFPASLVNNDGTVDPADLIIRGENIMKLLDSVGNDPSQTDFLGSKPTMLTHVVFHPVQKSRNRVLEITYKLRLVLG